MEGKVAQALLYNLKMTVSLLCIPQESMLKKGRMQAHFLPEQKVKEQGYRTKKTAWMVS